MFFIPVFTIWAGGIVTNTNQSASYARMLVRDASTNLDAVYFNPAGLTKLSDGLFISINNQSIFQDRTIKNDYKYLNAGSFDGKASAPLFPGIYAAYRIGDFAFSAGFNPVGGGGSAEYSKGLPSFEMPVADLVPGFGGPQNASYMSDIYFKGTSVYYGIQGGVSYKINDMISLFGGVRYIMAKNNYTGHMKNIMLKTNQPPYDGPASVFFQGAAAKYKAAKEQFAKAGLTDSAAKYGMLEAQMNVKATLLSDQDVEVEQTGSGITPIFGANITLLENNLNIGLKYELNTGLKLKNKTTKDVYTGYSVDKQGTVSYITKFPDGKETNADIPALLTIGASYKLMKGLSVAAGFHYYFDKNANWDGMQDSLDGNSLEFGVGLEYLLTDQITVSCGYLGFRTGAGQKYQTDMGYSQNTKGVALGGKYKLMDQLDVNLGFLYTVYTDVTKDNMHTIGGTTTMLPANYTFMKKNMLFGLGFDWHIMGK